MQALPLRALITPFKKGLSQVFDLAYKSKEVVRLSMKRDILLDTKHQIKSQEPRFKEYLTELWHELTDPETYRFIARVFLPTLTLAGALVGGSLYCDIGSTSQVIIAEVLLIPSFFFSALTLDGINQFSRVNNTNFKHEISVFLSQLKLVHQRPSNALGKQLFLEAERLGNLDSMIELAVNQSVKASEVAHLVSLKSDERAFHRELQIIYPLDGPAYVPHTPENKANLDKLYNANAVIKHAHDHFYSRARAKSSAILLQYKGLNKDLASLIVALAEPRLTLPYPNDELNEKINASYKSLWSKKAYK